MTEGGVSAVPLIADAIVVHAKTLFWRFGGAEWGGRSRKKKEDDLVRKQRSSPELFSLCSSA